jgi:hypothetical protein
MVTMIAERPMDPSVLRDIVTKEMPFGKYKGTKIYRLPSYYLEWFASKGFPEGKLGMWMSTVYEIKLNGLEHLLHPIIKALEKD